MAKRRRRRLGWILLLLIIGTVGAASGWRDGIETMIPVMRGEGLAVKVGPGEHAVRLDSRSGASTSIEGAGFQLTVPGFAEIYRFPKQSQTIAMHHEQVEHAGVIGRLLVRSRDGSAFFFDHVELEYRVTESGSSHFLRDSGGKMERASMWVMALARPVLCDEFGQYSVHEVMDATVCDVARVKSFDSLNALLAGHGMELLQLNMGKPNFDRDYEQAINQRKVADQEVERLGEELLQKMREQEQRLVKVRKEIEVRGGILDGDLVRELIEAETGALASRSAADIYTLNRATEGEVKKAGLIAQATVIETSGRAHAEAFEAELDALAGRGPIAIREQLVAGLSKVSFKLTPFSTDSTPERIERVDVPLSKANL